MPQFEPGGGVFRQQIMGGMRLKQCIPVFLHPLTRAIRSKLLPVPGARQLVYCMTKERCTTGTLPLPVWILQHLTRGSMQQVAACYWVIHGPDGLQSAGSPSGQIIEDILVRSMNELCQAGKGLLLSRAEQ